jgi:hypothetical protein
MVIKEKPIYVVDTPNIIFYGGYNQQRNVLNFIALVNYILEGSIACILSITPKMLKIMPIGSFFYQVLTNTQLVNMVNTGHKDPDEIVLQIANEHSLPLISNDKFRQRRYKILKTGVDVKNFIIKNGRIILLNRTSEKRRVYS